MISFVTEHPKHLIVDGNNVGRAWPDIAALWTKQRSAAQNQITNRLQVWHDAMGWRVTVVFDGRGGRLQVETPTDEASFVVAYSPRQASADTVIEQWVGRSREPASCVVATADAALASTVSATGASVISPADLASWLVRANETSRRRSEVLRQKGRR